MTLVQKTYILVSPGTTSTTESTTESTTTSTEESTTEESTTVDEPNIVAKPKMDFGKFSELKYGVSGEVFSKGNHQILDIKSFNYDGKGM